MLPNHPTAAPHTYNKIPGASKYSAEELHHWDERRYDIPDVGTRQCDP